ncbi:hypothetical protein PLICRDRAFT_199651 [Plicaturopsis crispa FD-325 SS-3]|nr:hypothetical protein PLICRDRAFT_199651 [Plicaturopsis crispa FD-325 SS-3]
MLTGPRLSSSIFGRPATAGIESEARRASRRLLLRRRMVPGPRHFSFSIFRRPASGPTGKFPSVFCPCVGILTSTRSPQHLESEARRASRLCFLVATPHALGFSFSIFGRPATAVRWRHRGRGRQGLATAPLSSLAAPQALDFFLFRFFGAPRAFPSSGSYIFASCRCD